MVETIQWTDGAVVMIDQTRLPLEEVFVTCRTYEEVAAAIRDMIIRGAPAIGVAAAMGVALGALQAPEADFDRHMAVVCDTLAGTRPTAVNLFWAIDRMKRLCAALRGRQIAATPVEPCVAGNALLAVGIALFALSRWSDVTFLAGLSMVIVIAGLVWTFAGLRMLRELGHQIAV